MSATYLDTPQIAALAASGQLAHLFPGCRVAQRDAHVCCGKEPAGVTRLRQALMAMSEARAREVRAALRVGEDTTLAVRHVSRGGVTERRF